MKQLLMALVMTVCVSSPLLAGEIPTVGIVAPPPPPRDGIQATTAPGEIPSGGSSYELTEAALELIQMFMGVGV